MALSLKIQANDYGISTCTIKSSPDFTIKATFEVERALTLPEKKQGLMFRKSLSKNHGMLFLYNPPQIVKFWMKNTEIPLDVLFADKNNHIISIYKNRVPFDLTLFGPDSKVHAILEIPAGSVHIYNLKVGDILESSTLK